MQEKVSFVSESFLEVLRGLPDDFAAKFKILKNKIFIPHVELQGLLAHYKTWLVNAGVGSYSEEKLMSRIFAGTTMTLFYLPEGNDVQIGYFANLPEGSSLKIPISNSVPINATDYLHPRDSDYRDLNGVDIRRPLNQPMEIVFNLRDQKFKCSESFLRKIVASLRLSKNISEMYPHLSRSLKDSLVPLRNILDQTKNLSRSKTPIIPLKYKGDESVKFLGFMHLVIISKNGVLLNFYENRGRGFDDFLDNEILYLADNLKIKTLDTLQILPKDKYLLGRIRIAGKWFVVEKKAFRILLESVALSRWFKGKLNKLFTIKDVLDQISPALKNADWIDVTKLGRNPNPGTTKNLKPKYELKYTPWTFKTGKNYSITEFSEGGGEVGKSNSHQRRGR